MPKFECVIMSVLFSEQLEQPNKPFFVNCFITGWISVWSGLSETPGTIQSRTGSKACLELFRPCRTRPNPAPPAPCCAWPASAHLCSSRRGRLGLRPSCAEPKKGLEEIKRILSPVQPTRNRRWSPNPSASRILIKIQSLYTIIHEIWLLDI
jgi:hypothetical protein